MTLQSVASPGESTSKPQHPLGRIKWHAVVLLLVVIFFGAIRWRLLSTPLERDEGEYAYAGQLMLQRMPPYKLAYNMKLPGTYAAYALIMAVFGQTPRGIHLGLLLVNAATVILVFLLVQRLFGALAAVVAAMTYALLSTGPQTLGFAGHATHFVVLAAVAGLLFLLGAEEREGGSLLFWSGIFFGLAFVMKQPGIFFGVFGLLYTLFFSWQQAVGWARIAIRAAVFLLGCAVPFLTTCAVMWHAGVFANFWLWTFSYARKYSGLVSLPSGWDLFTYHFVRIFAAAPAIWILALIGLVALFWDSQFRKKALFVTGLLVFSFIAVSAGLYFRSHYFLVVLPAIALLTGVAVEAAGRLLKHKNLALRAVPRLVFAAAFGWAIAINAAYYFRMTPVEACRATYGANEGFPEAVTIGNYLREHTSPSDRIVVLGSEPEIYFYSQRISGTGYIYAYPLMENQPYWQQMQQQMIAEVEASRPAYLVYFNDPSSWLTTVGSSRLTPFLNWANGYVKANYERVGLVELADPQSTFLWGDDAKSAHSQAQSMISVFRRNEKAGSSSLRSSE